MVDGNALEAILEVLLGEFTADGVQVLPGDDVFLQGNERNSKLRFPSVYLAR